LGRSPTLTAEKRDPEKPFLPKCCNGTDFRGGKKGCKNTGTELSSSTGDAAGMARGLTQGAAFAPAPLPTAQPPAPAGAGRELVCFSLRETWTGIKHPAVTLCRFAGEGCPSQAEDAASLLSAEKVAHLPASACHAAGEGSPPPPTLCLIPTIFCSVPKVSLTPSPSTLSPAPVRIFMR